MSGDMNMSILLKYIKESDYNMYGGQQVCSFRDSDLEEGMKEILETNIKYLGTYLQDIYDMGCAAMDMKIVCYGEGEFELDLDFGDYEDWKFAEKRVIKNCNFLKKMGHKKFLITDDK